MKGRSVGTVTGFTLVPELKGVEGIGEVKLYDTSDGVMQDLIAGRLDMAILDPPLVQWAIRQHPEWKLKQVPLQPEPDKYPIMSTGYNVIFGINHELQELARRDQCRQIERDLGGLHQRRRRWPNTAWATRAWFTPPPEKDPRIGVDRPQD